MSEEFGGCYPMHERGEMAGRWVENPGKTLGILLFFDKG
jgi:hypothetical protein